jgi:RNA polymerase sigma factor (sigma-70 family)
MTIHDNYELFLSIIETNKGIIYKIANSFCRDIDDRKDLAQEIILKLWKSFDTYNEQAKHSTWIYRVSLNVAISFYRKEKSRSKINVPFSENIFHIAHFENNTSAALKEFFLTRFLSELKELDRALLLLYLEERSHKEIAQIIGITETNVATKIGRIKTILKQKFSQIET